ncbi:MAG: AraC family transcriptional regulator [Treponema sp.]|jgi:AraC-like DNA-binding protein|nr:AraC family transcriptional regulator [Treponema sp.]
MFTASNIIKRREIEPLLIKAGEVVKTYTAATNTIIALLDQNGRALADFPGRASRMCLLCKKYISPGAAPENGYPCAAAYPQGIDGAIQNARKSGRASIVMCDKGLMVWLCPLCSSGRTVGALIAQGVLGIKRREAAERIAALSAGSLPAAEAEAALAEYPERTSREIKALAQTLRFCADRISRETGERRGLLPAPGPGGGKGPQPWGAVLPYPLEKERTFLAALRRGDHEQGKKLLAAFFVSPPGNFPRMQLRAIELVVLLSREAFAANAAEGPKILEANNQYIKRIQETKHPDALIHTLQLIIERMASRIFSFQGVRHAAALRKAERFIWENYTRKISLREIAAASGLSGPYFCSIFKEEMGENLSGYINRLRIEKAAALLAESDTPLNEIAGLCGFEDPSWFSKIFKAHMGVNPRRYREQGKANPEDFAAVEGNKEIS